METENVWRKRVTMSLTCPTGNVVAVRRPGPDLVLKAGKIARILRRKDAAGATNIDAQLEFIGQLPDDELDKLMSFARVLLTDVVLEPLLSLHPKEGQLGPDDVPLNDFWFIFTWAMNGGPGLPVKLKEGETTVDAVQIFPGGQDGSVDVSGDGQQVQ